MTMTSRDPLDLDAKAYAALLDPDYCRAAASVPGVDLDWAREPPARLRAAYAAAADARRSPIADGVDCTPWTDAAGALLGLAFEPRGATRDRAVLYLHGGGWIVGSPDTHRGPCSHLARQSGWAVYSASYRLAPEHPYPAQVEDARRALSTLLAANPEVDVCFAGDSAGAALAFWTAAALTPPERARITGICGFYGAYGLRESASFTRFGPVCPGLGARDLAAYRSYLAPAGSLQPPSIIESATSEGPPVLLYAAALDPLRDDSFALAARLAVLGRSVEVLEASRLPHGFLHLAGRASAVDDVIAGAGNWISMLRRRGARA
ncbi:MAG: alpha/beta hydrolase fold domain-containing protein [Pseudomonadota bacterium]